jgi:hypothetical protein
MLGDKSSGSGEFIANDIYNIIREMANRQGALPNRISRLHPADTLTAVLTLSGPLPAAEAHELPIQGALSHSHRRLKALIWHSFTAS